MFGDYFRMVSFLTATMFVVAATLFGWFCAAWWVAGWFSSTRPDWLIAAAATLYAIFCVPALVLTLDRVLR